MNNDLIYHW